MCIQFPPLVAVVIVFIIIKKKTFYRLPFCGGSGASNPEHVARSRCIRRPRGGQDSCGSAVYANLS